MQRIVRRTANGSRTLRLFKGWDFPSDHYSQQRIRDEKSKDFRQSVTPVTDRTDAMRENVLRIRELQKLMATPSLVRAIGKLAAAGERAGFTLEEMIHLLDSGVSVETLLELITRRLADPQPNSPHRSNWIM